MLAKEEVQRALNLWQAESDRCCRNALGGAAASLGDGGDRGGPVEQARRGAASCCEVSDGATAVGAGPRWHSGVCPSAYERADKGVERGREDGAGCADGAWSGFRTVQGWRDGFDLDGRGLLSVRDGAVSVDHGGVDGVFAPELFGSVLAGALSAGAFDGDSRMGRGVDVLGRGCRVLGSKGGCERCVVCPSWRAADHGGGDRCVPVGWTHPSRGGRGASAGVDVGGDDIGRKSGGGG